MTKRYYGFREKANGDTTDVARVFVEIAGPTRHNEPQKNSLQMSKLAASKSPTGFNWGYGGSGPAALAHSILTDATNVVLADEFYQEFKRDRIATLPQNEPWSMDREDILSWLLTAIQKLRDYDLGKQRKA